MRVLRRTRGRRTWMHTSIEDAMDGLGTEASVCARAHTHTHTRTHTMVSGHTVEAPTAVRHLPVLFRPFSQARVCCSLARVLLACLCAVRACACGGERAVCAQPCVYPSFAHWHAGSRACFDLCRHAGARGCGMRARTNCVRANVCAVATQTAPGDCRTRTRNTWPYP